MYASDKQSIQTGNSHIRFLPADWLFFLVFQQKLFKLILEHEIKDFFGAVVNLHFFFYGFQWETAAEFSCFRVETSSWSVLWF